MTDADRTSQKMINNEPALEINSRDLPHNSGRSTYIVYQKKDSSKKVVASAKTADQAFEKALNKGYKRGELSVSFNNKENKVCLF